MWKEKISNERRKKVFFFLLLHRVETSAARTSSDRSCPDALSGTPSIIKSSQVDWKISKHQLTNSRQHASIDLMSAHCKDSSWDYICHNSLVPLSNPYILNMTTNFFQFLLLWSSFINTLNVLEPYQLLLHQEGCEEDDHSCDHFTRSIHMKYVWCWVTDRASSVAVDALHRCTACVPLPA